MRVGSLFSGIGGLDLGLERAGMVIAWQVEIDPFCRRVLERHWPHVPRYGDIRELTGEELEPVDLICGGFPCQPVSLAGRRRGPFAPRWLWPEFARILRVVRPRWALLENVPGLLVWGMGDVLGDLATLGYDAEWSVFPACAVGAPHTRERVFIVAHADGFNGSPRLGVLDQHDWSRSWAVREREDLARARERWLAAIASADRGADGFPDWLDRLEALGNAVVPQVAEWIGRLIMAAEERARAREEAS